jgi:trans-aconitate methyltransferase
MKWDSSLYDQKHSFVFKYGEEVLALLNPQRGERILDVGCGTGHLTKLIAEAGAEVVGIDSLPEMVEAARAVCPDIRHYRE